MVVLVASVSVTALLGGAAGEITATKTSTWVEVGKTMEISIEEKKVEGADVTPKILFLGGLCNGHGLTAEAINESLVTAAKYGEVEYHLFRRAQDLSSSNYKEFKGTVTMGTTSVSAVTDSDFLLGYHAYLYDMANILKGLTIDSYDYIILEFDGFRIGHNSATPSSTQDGNLDKATAVLKQYYDADKVAWIVPDFSSHTETVYAATDTQFKKKLLNQTDTYMYNDVIFDNNVGSQETAYRTHVREVLKILSPDDLVNGEVSGTLADQTHFLERFSSDLSSEDKIWVYYNNAEDVRVFLEEKLGRFNVTMADTVVTGFDVTSVKGQYRTSDSDEWIDIDATETAKFSYTITETSEGTAINGKFNLREIYGETYIRTNPNNVRMLLSCELEEQDVTSENYIFTEENNYTVDTNVGNAVITVGNELYQTVKEEVTPNVSVEIVDVSYQFVNAPDGVESMLPESTKALKGSTYNAEATDAISLYGYTFTGWYTDAACQTMYTDGTTLSGDTILYGNWEAKEFAVSYKEPVEDDLPETVNPAPTVDYRNNIIIDPNGGVWNNHTSAYTMEITKAETISDATRDDYIFMGWEKVTTDLPEGVEFKLVAQWEKDVVGENGADGIPDKYQRTVNYNVVNGTWSDSTTATITKIVTLLDTENNWDLEGSATVTTPAGMIKDTGYKAVGAWDTTPVTTITKAFADGTTYTYEFGPMTATVTYDANGGDTASVPAQQTLTYTDAANVASGTPTKTNCIFKGWSTDPNATAADANYDAGAVIKAANTETGLTDLTLYAVWTAEVTYEVPQTDDYPTEVTPVPEVPVGKKVIVDPDNGIWRNSTSETTLDITEATDIENPTRDDYIFMGWEKVTTDLPEGVEFKLVATWEQDVIGENGTSDNIPDKYQKVIKYNVVNGTWADTTEATIEKVVTLVDENSKWSVNGTATVATPVGMIKDPGFEPVGEWDAEPVTTITSAFVSGTTYTYEFDPITATVTYDVNGGDAATTPASQNLTYTAETKVTTDDPTRENCIFKGWSTDPNATAADANYDAGAVIKAANTETGLTDLTLYAVWTAEVAYEVPQTDDYPTDVTPVPEVPVGKKVIVDPSDGTWRNSTSETTLDITEATDIENPTRDDYIFMGWEKVTTDLPEGVEFKLVATWEKDVIGENGTSDNIPDKYQKVIKYNVVNGTWSDSTEATIEKVVTLVDENSRWSVNGTATVATPVGMIKDPGFEPVGEWDATPVTTITSAFVSGTTYTYEFDPMTATVTYDANGGDAASVPAQQTLTYTNAATVASGTPTKANCIFKGWSTDPNATAADANYDAGEFIKTANTEEGLADLTLYAVWYAEVTYEVPQTDDYPADVTPAPEVPVGAKVIVDPDDGIWRQSSLAQTIDINEATDIENPTREDYVFMGWEKVTTDLPEGVEFKLVAIWEPDFIGENGTSDNIPDKYQKVIKYNVVNGTWADTTAETIEKVVTLLDENQKWSVNGTATVVTPEGMVKNPGYNPVGAWEEEPVTEINANFVSGTTYRYFFELTTALVHYNANGGDQSTAPADQELSYPNATNVSDVVPTRENCVFWGWSTDPDAKAADPAYAAGQIIKEANTEDGIEPLTLYAVWGAKINYNEPTDEEVPEAVDPQPEIPVGAQMIVDPNNGIWTTHTEPQTFDVNEYTEIEDATRENYIFMGWEKTTENLPEGVAYKLTAVWEPDFIGEQGGSDNIPDKYQRTINYVVINGTWDDETRETITKVVTLVDEEQKPSIDGTAEVVIPEGMIHDFGYKPEGAWDVEPTVVITKDVDEGATYTFTFEKEEDRTVGYYVPQEGGSPVPKDPNELMEYGTYFIVNPNGGEWPYGGETVTEPQTIQLLDNIEIENPVRRSFVFMGWEKVTDNLPENVEFELVAIWEPDTIGNQTEEETDVTHISDNIPDRYQVIVHFIIENGTWVDGTADEITYVYTLVDEDNRWSINGNAEITIPDGMVPNAGYTTKGSWNVTPKAVVTTTGEITYIYSFEKEVIVPPTGDISRTIAIAAIISAAVIISIVAVAAYRKKFTL